MNVSVGCGNKLPLLFKKGFLLGHVPPPPSDRLNPKNNRYNSGLQVLTQNSNHLLSSLPVAERNLVTASGRLVTLPQGAILSEPGLEIDYLTFPNSGMISLLAVMGDGRTVETASIGREGVLGGFGSLGLQRFPGRSVVSLPMTALRVSASDIRRLVQRHPIIRDTFTKYVETLLVQLFVSTACNALHLIELRFCRWLLRARDQLDDDNLPITQEMLAQFLGVRRASITDAAGNLELLGLIRRSRGHIVIVNRAGLEAAACECRAHMT